MKATFLTAFGYQGDAKNLPVADVDVALPFYQLVMGFQVLSRSETPQRSATLVRDKVEIALVENGADPEQDGCFFEVDNAETAFAELKASGLEQDEANYRIDKHGEKSFKVFFVIAPDGLCYCLGEHITE